MDQLLSIKSIPIEIEVNVQRAELKHIQDKVKNLPTINVTRQNNAVQLQAAPLTINVGSGSAARFDTFSQSELSDTIKLTYEGVARLGANENGGNVSSNNVSHGSSHHIKAQKASKSIESVLNSLPKTHNNSVVSFDNGKLSVNYSMDGSDSGFMLDESQFEFIPGKIEVIINQMPGIEIEYLGDPLYFPRSADPNYEPLVDTLA